MQKTKKDPLIELTIRQMRLEAKKSSIDLYSRKNKEELVELILEHREKDLIEDKNNDEGISEEERITLDEGISEEERITLENAKAVEEKLALEKAKAEEERITLENAKAVEEELALEKAKAEEERLALEKAKSEVEKNVIVDKNSNLKRILSESFPNKKISITDNKDGSQTILIY